MSPCEREDELTQVIRDGRWPALGESELALHARTCTACRDLVVVATAIVEDQQHAIRTAVVPATGVAWWRVQRRAARETVRAANRTVAAVQMASLLTALTLALTFLGTLGEWQAWLQALVRYIAFDGVHFALPLAVVVLPCATLAPVALYLAFSRD